MTGFALVDVEQIVATAAGSGWLEPHEIAGMAFPTYILADLTKEDRVKLAAIR